MKGDARSAGGMRISARHRRASKPQVDKGYLTQREARALFAGIREKEQKKGIFRRWNDRNLTPAEQKRIAACRPSGPDKKEPRKHRPRPRPGKTKN